MKLSGLAVIGHGSSARLSRVSLLASISIQAGHPARRRCSAGIRECSQRNSRIDAFVQPRPAMVAATTPGIIRMPGVPCS
jgi:hypothetical protein